MSDQPTAIFIGYTPVGEAIRVGRLVDAAGRLRAQGSTTCLMFEF